MAALKDELAEEVAADASGEDGTGADDAGEGWVVGIGIPEDVRDDGAGEVGDGGG